MTSKLAKTPTNLTVMQHINQTPWEVHAPQQQMALVHRKSDRSPAREAFAALSRPTATVIASPSPTN